MLNRDMISQQMQEVFSAMAQAMNDGDAEGAAERMQQAQETLCNAIEAEFEAYQNAGDALVLQQRGLRSLTSEETAWYQKFIAAAKSGARQEITNLTAAMPVTIVDRVIEDMKKEHELLREIDIQNAAGATKLVMNGVQMASKMGAWGVVTGAIAQELAGQIRVIDVTQAKYTAYFLIPKDFVKFNFGFAPMWVDQYIRIILSESIAFGLEQTILKGDGHDQFIGMIMDTSTSSNGRYSAKTAVAITNWDDDYAAVIGSMTKDYGDGTNGDYRTVPEVLLVVNPKDAVTKVRRAQKAITPAGIVDLINLTWPTKVVTSAKLSEGEAVVGIAKNYFAAINGGTSGIIEYDDSVQFIQDNRVYTTRVYGNGRPVDNTSFVLLDISNVEAPALPVKVKGTVKTKEQA